jgi:hypothetical protein
MNKEWKFLSGQNSVSPRNHWFKASGHKLSMSREEDM